MSDQREMTLDEYLESNLPDCHLARRQLLELREENAALAAHVKLISEDRSDLLERLRQFPGWTPTPLRADEWDQLTSDLITSVEETPDAPEASLARLTAEKQARHEWDWEDGAGERCVKCGDKDWMADPVCSEAKLRRQAEEA